MISISNTILEYASLIKKDEYHRYRSWEHCNLFFQKNIKNLNDIDLDLACLHLGFYIASWGMLRGSAFLLWKDYKIHKFAVKILLDRKYLPLNNINPVNIINDENLIGLIFNLKQEIMVAYIDNIKMINGSEKDVSPTNTLITKILLGTLACTPAYDANVKEGLRKMGFNNIDFTRDSILEISNFYNDNLKEFNKANNEIGNFTTKYPPMKLVDMFFWQIGLDKKKINMKVEKIMPTNLKVDNSASAEKSVFKLINEAINNLNDRFTRNELVNFVINKNKNVNLETLRRNIYRVTVNRQVRIHWHPNRKERITNSKYDLIYEISNEILEKYSLEKHGLWEIKEVNKKLKVSRRS